MSLSTPSSYRFLVVYLFHYYLRTSHLLTLEEEIRPGVISNQNNLQSASLSALYVCILTYVVIIYTITIPTV